MSPERRLEGLALKVGPLGDHDRLLTLLSDEAGLIHLAVPGARKPRSSMAAAVPLTTLELQVGGRNGLLRVRQLQVKHNFGKVGQRLETLAAAQALSELSISLVGRDDPVPGFLSAVLMHLERLEDLSRRKPVAQNNSLKTENLIPNSLDSTFVDRSLATLVQACVHLLALGGYGLPLQICCRSGAPLSPPIGQWDWRCSLLAEEGLAIGSQAGAAIQINPSELALLQRLTRLELPHRQDGELMGPRSVWLRLLTLLECWCRAHLPRPVRSFSMLRQAVTSACPSTSISGDAAMTGGGRT